MNEREKLIEAMAEALRNANLDDFVETHGDDFPAASYVASVEYYIDDASAAISAIESAGYVLAKKEPDDATLLRLVQRIWPPRAHSLTEHAREVYAAALAPSPMGENEASND